MDNPGEIFQVQEADPSWTPEDFVADLDSDESQHYGQAMPILDQRHPGRNSVTGKWRRSPHGAQLALFRKLARTWPIAKRENKLVPEGAVARKHYDALISQNINLPIRIARRCVLRVGRGLEFDDLFQEGLIGLMRAVAKFDPNLSRSFDAYATKFVYYGIVRAIDNQEHLIRVPVETAENLRRAQAAQRKALLGTGRSLPEGELARELALTVEDVRHLRQIVQLHDIEPLESGESANDSFEAPLEALSQHSLQRDVARVLSKLRPLEERLLRMRFGIPFGDHQSLIQISTCLGISREKAGLIESKAMRKLRYATFALGMRSFVA